MMAHSPNATRPNNPKTISSNITVITSNLALCLVLIR
jgi:hypothetical protein